MPQSAHREFEVVAIGTSAGGLPALQQVLRPLSQDFPCGVLIVQHVMSGKESLLADLLARTIHLPVREAVEGVAIEPGRAYVAPPDHHLTVRGHRVTFDNAPPVRFSRPSIDVMFRAVAADYGEHAVAVVLCGSNADGSEGVRAIKAAGGVTIAEWPEETPFHTMPEAAIATGCIDHVLPLASIATFLSQLCPAIAL